MATFIDTADSRQTSPEIMAAILKVAGSEERAVDIWENGPTSGELVAIVEIVTGNGVGDTHDYFWGWAGTKWADAYSTCNKVG